MTIFCSTVDAARVGPKKTSDAGQEDRGNEIAVGRLELHNGATTAAPWYENEASARTRTASAHVFAMLNRRGFQTSSESVSYGVITSTSPVDRDVELNVSLPLGTEVGHSLN